MMEPTFDGSSRRSTTRDSTADGDAYRIRRCDSDDLESLLALDETVWRRDRGIEWLRWKYVDTPYVDHIPIFLAERSGEIVGARPFLVFELRAGDTSLLALQPADTMVHPAHRRRGLFTRMTRRAIDYYGQREPAVAFNFPNAMARQGYLDLGWRHVRDRRTCYRIQRPAAMLDSRADGSLYRLLGGPLNVGVRSYNRIRDGFRRTTGPRACERPATVPVDRFVSLYEQRVPRQLHALRDTRFYRWRLASPCWERRAYFARRDGRTAGALARTRSTSEGITVTQVAEIVPMEGDAAWESAIASLLEAILDDHPGSDVLSLAGPEIPPRLLARFGFHPNDRPPLSWATRYDRAHLVRPLSGVGSSATSWCLNGRGLADPSDWKLSFLERDTA